MFPKKRGTCDCEVDALISITGVFNLVINQFICVVKGDSNP